MNRREQKCPSCGQLNRWREDGTFFKRCGCRERAQHDAALTAKLSVGPEGRRTMSREQVREAAAAMRRAEDVSKYGARYVS